MSKKLIIMVCIAAMIMTNIPNWDAGADVSGTAWSEAGDTLVGNATVWKDEVITLSGNLTINETGSLTLDNVTLLMNCTTNGSYYIEVKTGGEMYILNNSNITSANEYRYLFWVRNDSKFEMRDSELHGCGYNWNGLTIETDCVLIENSTFSDNWVGILFSSSNNTIANCTIYNNSLGIYLSSSSNNAIINCISYNNTWSGIALDASSDNNLITSSVCNSNLYGINVGNSLNNIIINCTTYNNFYAGIGCIASSFTHIINCTSYKNSHGIFLSGADSNELKNCLSYDNNNDGISLVSSVSNTITNCTCYNNSLFGISLDFSGSNTIINCRTYNSIFGIGLAHLSNNTILNCTLRNNSNSDISLNTSVAECFNTTFTTASFDDTISILNVSWYLNVNVLWNNSIPAEYANVTIIDNLVNEVFNSSTDKNGWIKYIVLQEYTQNQTNKTSFTPHNVTAWQGVFINSTNVTVNRTQDFLIIFTDHNAPEILNTSTVSPGYDENTTVEFSFNVSHPNDLILNCSWYVNNEIKNYTILKNTSTIQKINWTYYFNFTSHENSPYTINVTVFDGNATVSYTWILTVNDINGKPEIEFYYPPKDIILGNHSCVIFNVTASDPDNDVLSYQWRLNGAGVSNENEYIFYAEYNASENAINTYIIEVIVTDVTDEKLSVNQTWAVVVVDWNASYANLLQQIELLKNALENITKLIGNITNTLLNRTEILENITWLVENITALNMTLLKDKLVQLFNEIKNMTVTLKQVNENLTRIQGELNNATDRIANLTTMLENANATRDKANETRDDALRDEQDAENATKEMENKMNNAIEAKNKAEYKLGASVVCGVIGGIIAGFLVSFLLRRKLPKKGKT